MAERYSVWWLLVRAALVVALSGVVPLPSRAQEATPGQPGTVSGTVLDKGSRTPIIEAGVEIVGQKKTVRTDLDGRYSIKLPPGSYELRIFAPSYQEVRLKGVTVKTGAVTKADATLAAGAGGAAGVDVVEVYAKRKKAAEASALTERKEAAVVKDTISRETMAKTTGSEASDLVQRAPAVTVKDDRFVFVRGLSERYTSALLNGSRLPSPDPLRRAVPLDLFPADFLDSIGIVKTYSPDLPGDFSGGLVELNLRDLPDQLTYSFGASFGGNTQTTFQDFNTYHGTNWDYFGLGEDYRALSPPAGIALSAPYEGRFQVAKGWHNIWSPTTINAPPNFGANFAVGDRFGPVGFQLGGLYSSEWTTKRDQINRQFGNNGSPDAPIIGVRDDLRAETGTYQAKLGGVLTTGYQLNDRHEFAFRAFVYQNAVDRTTLQHGTLDQAPERPVRLSFLQYTPENLAYGQLSGDHHFADWLQLEWRTVLSRTTRDEPDTRFTQYIFTEPPPQYTFSVNKNRGGLRISNSTEEWLSDTMGDITIPFKTALPLTTIWDDLPAKFKFGPAYSYRAREFSQREFLYRPQGGALDLTQSPEEILAPNNLVEGIVNLEELTDVEDSFDASQEIMGAYGLFELPLVRDRLRVTGGARVEYSLIRLNTGLIAARPGDCPGNAPECVQQFRKKTVDPLPGMSLIWSPLDNMNVRLAYGESVARPEFRELAPARFPTPPGERAKRGNPDLVQAEIKSYDFRWEWFFPPLELVSVGFFYKELAEPIEQVTFIEGTRATDTWVNGGDATLIGAEFEGRKDFGFINQRLKPFSLLTNVTWSDSSVTVPTQRVSGLTTLQNPAERTLVGQSPFIINSGIEYTDPERLTARLLYYTAGQSIASAGFNGLPDIFFDRRDQLDAVLIVPLKRWLTVPITAKLSAENLLNAPFVFTQGDVVQQRYTNGVKFTFGLSYTH